MPRQRWTTYVQQRLVSMTAGLALVICTATFGDFMMVTPASASGNDYPWSSYDGPGSDPSTYTWYDPSGTSDLSPLKFGYRNCTDYAAFELNEQLGGNTSNNIKFSYSTYGFSNGNAAGWKTAITTKLGASAANGTPAVGAVAWWGTEVASGFGHVSMVTGITYNADGSVNSITTADYNSGDPIVNGSPTWGNYATHTLTPSSGWPDSFLHVADAGSGSSGGTTGLPLYARNLVGNAGFNSDANFGWWNTYPGTNRQWYAANNGLTGGTNPYEGDQFLATNAYQSGGSIYQDVGVTTSNGQNYCLTAMLTTADQSATSGGSGSLNLFNLSNGTVVNAGATNFSNLPNNNQWQKVMVCLPITATGNDLRVQLYPTVGGKTIGVDAVTLNQDITANGGFESGTGWWNITANTNFTTYGANNGLTGGTQPYEGSHFGATNATGAQASIYQDTLLTVSNGNEFCISAMLTTADSTGVSGGFGDLNLYAMNGGNVVSGATTHFSNLPNGNQWVEVHTCVYVTGSGDRLRVQLYPGLNSPTIGVDAINVNQDLVANGGFEAGTGWWNTYPGTNTAIYGANNGLTGGTNPPEGSNFLGTNAYQSGGSIYQDILIPLNSGQEYCVTALLTTADQSGTTGGSGSLNLFNLNSGSVVNVGSTNFSGLPNNNQWVQVETCINVTGTGNDLRVQLYPTVAGKTLGVDVINVI